MYSMMDDNIISLPTVRQIAAGKELSWENPEKKPAEEALGRLRLTKADVEDAARRLLRFAPYFVKAFPETAECGGLIESPLTEIPGMKRRLNEGRGADLQGRLFLKRDSELAVAGSVKARGGIYEVLKHSEELALSAGLLHPGEDYAVFASEKFRDFFRQYAIHVGSTGNLGLSIGIISAALGYRATVHMSADAKQWKKDLLRQKGVQVTEYVGSYSQAVAEGRKKAAADPYCYFVDDENSVNLFLGYAVAARRLKAQLEAQQIPVDAAHPLAVYIPCGVGGAPGGICFGLKQEFGDAVQVYFCEPTQCPCMLLGLVTGLHNRICVEDIGLSGRTAADGLACGRPSGFVGETVKELLSGEFTVDDSCLTVYLRELFDSEGIFIEPSSCAAFAGPARGKGLRAISEETEARTTHIVWATGGSLVPPSERKRCLEGE